MEADHSSNAITREIPKIMCKVRGGIRINLPVDCYIQEQTIASDLK